MLSELEGLQKLSFPTRVMLRFRGHMKLYIWISVTSALAAIVWYLELPLVVLPGLLFVTFLASGGRTFPKVFLRTFYRDLIGSFRYANLIFHTVRHSRKNRTIADIFQLTTAKHPQKVAIKFEEQTWTFQEVENYSNKVANHFKSQGYKKGDVVALILENSPEFVCLWLGLSKLGVVTALINTNLRLDSLWYCISVANTKAIIFGSNLSGAVREIQRRIPDVVQLYALGMSSPTVNWAFNLDKCIEECSAEIPVCSHYRSFGDVMLYIYTSGTTGMPKAAIITCARFFRYAYGAMCAVAIHHNDVIYCSLPLYHSAGGILGVGQCLLSGCTLVLRQKFSASKFWDDCVKSKATVIQYIGELCRYLLAQPHHPAEKQHFVRLALGNGLRPQIWGEFQTRFGIKQIGEFYGSTEGTASIINTDNTPGACGFVSEIAPSLHPVVIVKVDPDTGELVRGPNGLAVKTEAGEVGQIVGRSFKGDPSWRFDGYLNPVETLKKIGHDVLRKGDTTFLSGDLVVRDEYGYIYFHDRTGDTFRWHGENVSTTEVESVISKALGLRDVVVYGVTVPGTEGRAGMAAVVDQESKISFETLAQSLKQLLPSYAIPVFLRIVHKVEVTGTFKLQKSTLKKEGFDIGIIEDKLFYFDPKAIMYFALDESKYEKIIRGEIRM